MYKCLITSPGSRVEFMTDIRSALRAAKQHGKREPGETVRIYSDSGALLTMAKWSGSKYYSLCT